MSKTKGKTAQRVNRSKKAGNSRKDENVKPLKIAALIFSAIQDLKETKGTTPSKITGYISFASNLPESRLKKQVKSVLKRGVEYGILRRFRGHYFLPTTDELDRANRVAGRFARLPTPVSSRFKKNMDTRRSCKTMFPMIKRVLRRSQSLPDSPVKSFSTMGDEETPAESDVE